MILLLTEKRSAQLVLYLTKHAAGTFQGVCADIDSPPPPLVQLSKIPATPHVLHVSNHLHHLLQPRWWEMFTDFPTIFFLNLITTNWSKKTNLNLCRWYCIVLWQNTRSWNVGNVGLLHQLSKILQHTCKLWHSFHCLDLIQCFEPSMNRAGCGSQCPTNLCVLCKRSTFLLLGGSL